MLYMPAGKSNAKDMFLEIWPDGFNSITIGRCLWVVWRRVKDNFMFRFLNSDLGEFPGVYSNQFWLRSRKRKKLKRNNALHSKEKKTNNTLALDSFGRKYGDLFLNQYDLPLNVSRTFSPWRPIMESHREKTYGTAVYSGVLQQADRVTIELYGKVPTIYRFRFRERVLNTF